MLLGLAWRNVWRQPHRTWLSLASIVIAGIVTVFLLSLQRGAYGAMEENVLKLADGFAQIQPRGYADDPDLRKAIDQPAALMARIEALRGVTASAPRATTYAILSNGDRSFGAAVFGVDPAREPKVSVLDRTMTQGRYLNTGDDGAAVVGAGLARNLGLAPGADMTLLGGARDGSVAADIVRVVGVFSTGAPELDRQVIEMPLTRFRADFAMGERVNVIAVAGRNLAAIDRRLPDLRALAEDEGLVARGWTQLEPALHDAILLDISFSSLLYVSLVVIVAFIILNMLLMSVLERTREFGMLLAIGMRPEQIGRMVWLELLILAGAGAALGVLIGAALTAWTAHAGIKFAGAEALFERWHMPSTLYPQLDLVSALAGPLALALAIVLAGTIPYAHIRRLEPVAAMRAT
jgi:putative ABC transport system permease protein